MMMLEGLTRRIVLEERKALDVRQWVISSAK